MNIEQAIAGRQVLEFTYKGYRRVVEPHTYGVDANGHRALRAYQVEGGSASGSGAGWRLFHVDDMRGVRPTGLTFSRPRPDYQRGDSAFGVIYAEV